MGAINPGGIASGESSILIPADAYPALVQQAVLQIRFQEMKPIPYQISWSIDNRVFPA